MIYNIELVLLPQEAADKGRQIEVAAALLSLSPERIFSVNILKRSIDARSRQPKIRLAVEVFVDEVQPIKKDFSDHFQFQRDVSKSKPVIIHK